MRLLLTLVLLLVQLGPLAGAGLCLHGRAEPTAGCAMPMPGMTHDDHRPHSSSSPECAQMIICAPAAPIAPTGAVRLPALSQPSHTTFTTPAALVLGDPTAPPEPPPIA